MDELLAAIRLQDTDRVRILANQLFLTRTNYANKAQINEFEKFAPCKIRLVKEEDGYVVIGKIYYSNILPFTFG